MGLSASPNVHEIAREHDADARVVYLDRDPVVLSHARALLATDENIGVVAGISGARPGHWPIRRWPG